MTYYNELLARWQGLDSHNCDPHSFHCDGCERGSIQTPYYLNDDAACGSLLDTLVEKGYCLELLYGTATKRWHVLIWIKNGKFWEPIFDDDIGKLTRREAIVAACLEVVRKERGNGLDTGNSNSVVSS